MVSDDLAMQVATFRFGVIADFVTGVKLSYGERQRILNQKAERTYQIPGSPRTRIGRSTILSWICDYKKAGFRLEGLFPKVRKDKGTYRKLDTTLRMAIKELKTENLHYTVPVMITKLKHNKILAHDEKINKSSLYRFLKRENLHEVTAQPTDKRKFEASCPNEIWQCDVMHGPLLKMPEGPQRKAYLCAIMDDHSRLIVHAQFYLTETVVSLKDCLRQAILRRGIPSKFYVDNGACYRALHIEQILAGIGVALTHSRPYKPEGRGKIERWFRYVRQDFIPLYADKPLLLSEINERLESWVDRYNNTPHSGIKMSPYERFRQNLACIRPAPQNLMDYFRQIEFRRVRKDRTVQLGGRFFEVPVGLIDKKIELRFHEENGDDVEIFFENRSHGKAVLLDVHVNARIGRDYGPSTHKPSDPQPIPTAPEITSGKLFSRDGVQ